MQNADVLIRVVIPVVLLIFWGLSSVFNREKNEKATKERTSGNAPRPTLYQTPRPQTPQRASGQNDDVMVIRGEPGRTPSRQPQPQRRNAGKGRGSAAAQGRRGVEPAAPSRELLGGNVVSDVNQSLNRPLELRSLSETMALSPSASGTASVSSQSSTLTAATIDLRAALKDPIRIREAFVLNEVLGPPISRRGR